LTQRAGRLRKRIARLFSVHGRTIVFIRFVVDDIDRSSGKRSGVFQAAYALRDSGRLPEYDEARLADGLRWFARNLRKPTRLTRSRRPHREAQAICWFKRGAFEHIERVHEMRHLLEAYGIPVDTIASRRPGYIVYEDAFQIAAYPFGETPA
jgi:hypothetical protein